MSLVDNNLIRPDQYMHRLTLRSAQGNTKIPDAKAKVQKNSKVSNFDAAVYTRVGANLSRSQDVLRNTVHNITTLHGMRHLAESKSKTQEERILSAINYEQHEDGIKNLKNHDPYLVSTVEPKDHDFSTKKPIITEYITPTGKELPDKLYKVTKALGKSHLVGKMHKNKRHGDAGLPVGEKQF